MDTEKLLSGNRIRYGIDTPLPAQVPLRAGPLELLYEVGSLRYIKSGETELVRMIYVALRDKRWGTYIPRISNEEIHTQPDSFRITYSCAYYHQRNLLFSWNALISGDTAGKIYFEMNGKANADFEKNRLGICVLHPIEPLKDKKVNITHRDLTQSTGSFPVLVSPHQPFKNIRSMEYYPVDKGTVSLTFAGDIFEMEDQRNWTDASYKTYSTPLEIPIPAKVKRDDTFFQSVTMQVSGFSSEKRLAAVCTLLPYWKKTKPLPALGIRQSSQYDRLIATQIELLRSCRFNHYRIDVHVNQPGWLEKLQNGLQEARQLETGLEIGIHLDETNELKTILDTLALDKQLVRSVILYFRAGFSDEQLREKLILSCKQYIPNAAAGIGTEGFFADINRNRPGQGSYDFIVFSVNPQVHAFDYATIIENLEAQKYPIETIQSFISGKEIHISPLEFRMNFAPEELNEDILPYQYDPRQMSLFAAGWTLGCIKYLAESGVASITSFETVGKRGILAGENEKAGAPVTAFPHMIYPVYYIFRELAANKDYKVIDCKSDLPLQVSCLLLSKDDQLRLLIANHTEHEVSVDLTHLGHTWTARQMDDSSMRQALFSTAAYEQLSAILVENKLTLAPFAVSLLSANMRQ
jgi:hypothetical protein